MQVRADRDESFLTSGVDEAVETMLAAYNAGPGAVLAAHDIPQNGQTPAYVTRITTDAANFADTTGTSPTITATAFGARVAAYARTQRPDARHRRGEIFGLVG